MCAASAFNLNGTKCATLNLRTAVVYLVRNKLFGECEIVYQPTRRQNNNNNNNKTFFIEICQEKITIITGAALCADFRIPVLYKSAEIKCILYRRKEECLCELKFYAYFV